MRAQLVVHLSLVPFPAKQPGEPDKHSADGFHVWRLFRAQRDHRIDSRRAPIREKTRGHGRRTDHQRSGDQRQLVERMHAVEHFRNQRAGPQRETETGGQSYERLSDTQGAGVLSEGP